MGQRRRNKGVDGRWGEKSDRRVKGTEIEKWEGRVEVS